MKPSEVAACWESNAEAWTRHSRAGFDVYRDALNTPAFLSMLPAVAGLKGLDIGCGEGSNTRKVAERGASMTGIDVAPTFIKHALALEAFEPRGIAYRVADAMALPFPGASFDFATSFMCLMDLPDQPRALAEAHRVLKPGGFLQFSILHPCFAPPHRKVLREPDGTVRAVEVGGYYEENTGNVDTWWFSELPREEREKTPPFKVPRFHRTLTGWFEIIRSAGFQVDALAEPRAEADVAEEVDVVADTRVVPLFLHFRVRKPPTATSA